MIKTIECTLCEHSIVMNNVGAKVPDIDVCGLFRFSGLDGSRTRVQKPIPCPSTIIVCLFAAGLAPARSLLNPGADTLIHSVAS